MALELDAGKGGGASEEEEPPDRFICAITRDVMDVPVVAKDSHTYDQEAIRTWVRRSGTSPMTRERMREGEWYLNLALKNEIDAWRAIHRPQKPPTALSAARGKFPRPGEEGKGFVSRLAATAVFLATGAGVYGAGLCVRAACTLACACCTRLGHLAAPVTDWIFEPAVMKVAMLAHSGWSVYPHARELMQAMAFLLAGFVHCELHKTRVGMGIVACFPLLGGASVLGLAWFIKSPLFWFTLRAHAVRAAYKFARRTWTAWRTKRHSDGRPTAD